MFCFMDHLKQLIKSTLCIRMMRTSTFYCSMTTMHCCALINEQMKVVNVDASSNIPLETNLNGFSSSSKSLNVPKHNLFVDYLGTQHNFL